MVWTPERILEQSRQCGARRGTPPTAEHVTAGHYELYLVGGDATLMSYRGALAAEHTVFDRRPIPVPDDVDVVELSTYEQVVEFERTTHAAWGYAPPSADDLAGACSRLSPGGFLAYRDQMSAGTGGFTLVGDVARFWGAAVVPAMRGRGVYRALVHARLAGSASRGATLALVHAGRTSSPILQRLGFVKYGQRRTISIDVGATPA